MATASTIIKTASNEIGVKETGNNNVKYNTEYYGKAVNGDAYPWCAVFVWWVFKHSGASSIFYGDGKRAVEEVMHGDIGATMIELLSA